MQGLVQGLFGTTTRSQRMPNTRPKSSVESGPEITLESGSSSLAKYDYEDVVQFSILNLINVNYPKYNSFNFIPN